MSQQIKILVVEDEKDISELIGFQLKQANYDIAKAYNGLETLQIIRDFKPDLILLDLMLPGVDGLELCRQIKGSLEFSKTPIIMLTAKGEEQDIVKGLELGADDYITKPFSPKVLLARVKAVLKRYSGSLLESSQHIDFEKDEIRVNDIYIHMGRREVFFGEAPVSLTKLEFQILQFLAQKPGWVFTRTQIMDAIHGENYAITERSIDFQMVGLRKKMGNYCDYIETVRGIGYRFKEATNYN